ncbi:MAG: TIGR03435 family protein [Candidatus Acidiferrales bacterium]
MAIAIPLALGTVGCASKGGTHGAEESNRRHPWFDTASIKPSEDTRCCAMTLSKDRLVATESTIDMIMFAYGEQHPLKPAQVLGGPDWMTNKVFRIHADLPKSLSDQVKAPLRSVGPGPGYPDEVLGTGVVKQVFRSLLINRFKLQIKHETKVLPVYELALAKNGPKIAKNETAGASCRMTDVGPDLPSAFVRGKGLWLNVESCDFDTFAGLLSASPELRSRVLVDKTGLHGRYSFKLHWTPKIPPGMPQPTRGGQRNQGVAPSKPSGPSLLTALREQLGLNVQSATTPVDTIAIQHIEDPAKN